MSLNLNINKNKGKRENIIEKRNHEMTKTIKGNHRINTRLTHTHTYIKGNQVNVTHKYTYSYSCQLSRERDMLPPIHTRTRKDNLLLILLRLLRKLFPTANSLKDKPNKYLTADIPDLVETKQKTIK